MKKISMQKDDRIDFLWDKYILECRLQGYSETTLRNKEYYFSVFYRFLGETECESFNKRRVRIVLTSENERGN